ncbi:MAG: pyridoxal phosphate-dependent aminotransferase, partial [Vallitaleaceae bacterium]|nr:pyridoxal phosphate-dependent aminotransferase [Vallitaleaceae bacterium]
EVIEALVEKSRHGIFGYSESNEDYYNVLHTWFRERFNWKIKPQWLVKTPGVVYAITTAIKAFSKVDEAVMIQEPVYYPFSEAIRVNEREAVINQLVYKDGRYEIDFEDFETKIVDHEVKLFILCNPHNPVGRVWKKDELIRLGDICLKYQVLVISDEIHADFIYPGFSHLVFADLKPEYEAITITCTAPSKTFNLAGLQISNVLIANARLKKIFKAEIVRSGYSQLNIMGIIACKAAYEMGHQWLEVLKVYLTHNLDFVRSYLSEHVPNVDLVEPEGTYLVWLNFSKFQALHQLTDKEMNQIIIHKAKLWLDEGNIFGLGGSGFQRINIACPQATLKKAMEQLTEGLKSID